MRTSLEYRRVLCEVYGAPPDALFAHQDAGLITAPAPRLLVGAGELRAAMRTVVDGAREYLVVTGSRSRDEPYLEAIEQTLRQQPAVVHYRVLYGPPHRRALVDHLLRLLEFRDPRDRSLGVQTIHLGVVEDLVCCPERFFVASERGAVISTPSLTSPEAFDSGVVLPDEIAERLIDHGRQAYAGARRVETAAAVRALTVLLRHERGEESYR